MANMNINLDMDRVQSSVQAAIRPAVEKALAGVDIEKIIQKELTAKRAARDDVYSMMMLGRGGRPPPETLLDEMVRSGISAIAKEYVERELRAQRPEIEAAFHRMMAGSSNRLVKAFSGAVDRALKEDWGFELDVKVKHETTSKTSP